MTYPVIHNVASLMVTIYLSIKMFRMSQMRNKEKVCPLIICLLPELGYFVK